MANQVTVSQRRIARDLRKGSSGHHENQLVTVKASDVIEVLDALDAETQRADDAEKRAATAPAADAAAAQ